MVAVLMKLSKEKRDAVEEVTMDFSDSMHAIVEQCFPKAMITIDRFHAQQLCTDAMQELRVRIKREERKKDIEAHEQHKYKLKRRETTRKADKTDPRGRKRRRKNEVYKPQRMANGDTAIELLTHAADTSSCSRLTNGPRVRRYVPRYSLKDTQCSRRHTVSPTRCA